MIDCQTLQERLAGADDSITPAPHALSTVTQEPAVREHLDGCHECRDFLTALQQLDEMTLDLPPRHAPDALLIRTLANVSSMDGARGGAVLTFPSRREVRPEIEMRKQSGADNDSRGSNDGDGLAMAHGWMWVVGLAAAALIIVFWTVDDQQQAFVSQARATPKVATTPAGTAGDLGQMKRGELAPDKPRNGRFAEGDRLRDGTKERGATKANAEYWETGKLEQERRAPTTRNGDNGPVLGNTSTGTDANLQVNLGVKGASDEFANRDFNGLIARGANGAEPFHSDNGARDSNKDAFFDVPSFAGSTSSENKYFVTPDESSEDPGANEHRSVTGLAEPASEPVEPAAIEPVAGQQLTEAGNSADAANHGIDDDDDSRDFAFAQPIVDEDISGSFTDSRSHSVTNTIVTMKPPLALPLDSPPPPPPPPPPVKPVGSLTEPPADQPVSGFDTGILGSDGKDLETNQRTAKFQQAPEQELSWGDTWKQMQPKAPPVIVATTPETAVVEGLTDITIERDSYESLARAVTIDGTLQLTDKEKNSTVGGKPTDDLNFESNTQVQDDTGRLRNDEAAATDKDRAGYVQLDDGESALKNQAFGPIVSEQSGKGRGKQGRKQTELTRRLEGEIALTETDEEEQAQLDYLGRGVEDKKSQKEELKEEEEPPEEVEREKSLKVDKLTLKPKPDFQLRLPAGKRALVLDERWQYGKNFGMTGELSGPTRNELDEHSRGRARALLDERLVLTGIATQPTNGLWANTYVPGDPVLRLLHGRLAKHRAAVHPAGTAAAELAELDRTARPYLQAFDTPTTAALGVSVRADRQAVDGPARMLLQVGLKGTPRRSGRRPAMNIAVVLDLHDDENADVIAGMPALLSALRAAKQSGDRFSLMVAGRPGAITLRPDQFRHGPLTVALQQLFGEAGDQPVSATPAATLTETFAQATAAVATHDDQTGALGTSMILLITGAQLPSPTFERVLRSAHKSAVDGIGLSVIGVGGAVDADQLTRLAAAGQGSRRLLGRAADAPTVIADELSAAASVVARAVRVRVKLAPGVKLVGVVGSHRLGAEAARKVREAEKSIDKRVERARGITSDRDDDRDGVNIVIPGFLADDAHVILLDVIAPGPGQLADVTVRYKDLVFLQNGVARGSLVLGRGQRTATSAETSVFKNYLGHVISQKLRQAGNLVAQNSMAAAVNVVTDLDSLLRGLPGELPYLRGDAEFAKDRQLVGDYLRLVRSAEEGARSYVSDSLRFASWRKVMRAATTLPDEASEPE